MIHQEILIDLSEQTYTLECADLNAIAVKWHYDTSGTGKSGTTLTITTTT